MRNPERPALADFIRHAERFGSEYVYETALDYLHDPHELGLLSLALQRIDRRWGLSREQQASLALALYDARTPSARICEMAQLSRTTLFRLRKAANEVAESAKSPSEVAQQCGMGVADPAASIVDTDLVDVKHRRRPRPRRRARQGRARTHAGETAR